MLSDKSRTGQHERWRVVSCEFWAGGLWRKCGEITPVLYTFLFSDSGFTGQDSSKEAFYTGNIGMDPAMMDIGFFGFAFRFFQFSLA